MGLRTFLGLKKKTYSIFLNESYSQEGEDGILHRIFEHKKEGFFIDVGAHHPIRFSNTYKLYNRGWQGINIDAMPGSMSAFRDVRSRDINLEIPISDQNEILAFYIFNEPALNTFSEEIANECIKKAEYKIDRVVKIETQPLFKVLDEYLPENQTIDFLTIDAEGFDFRILQSNNWTKYKPSIVLVESEMKFPGFLNSELYQYMQSIDYEFFAKTVRTYFLKLKTFDV